MELRKGYKQTEVGLIPFDWEYKALDEVGVIIRGASPRPQGDKRYYGGNVPRLMVEDVTRDGKFVTPNVDFLTEAGAKLSRPCEKGTLTIVCSGTVGIPSILAVNACIHDGFLALIKIKKEYHTDYLYHLLTKLREQFESSATHGGVFTNLTTSILKEFKVSLPNLKEQISIANTLSDVDNLISCLEKFLEKKRNIKQGVMQQLLNGKKRLDGFKEKWQESDIASLCISFTKQTGFDYSAYIKPSLVNKYEKGTIPFIQNKDFNGLYINFDTDYFIPEKIANNFPRILLDEKCLLISISGSIGRVAVFSNAQKAFIGGAVAVGKFKDKSILEWVLFNLQSQKGQDKLFINVKSGSHQNLILDDIRKIKIPIPSREERDKIVLILTDIENEILLLEEKLSKAKMLKQGMMQELLTGKIRLV